jgi:hypothetical protein
MQDAESERFEGRGIARRSDLERGARTLSVSGYNRFSLVRPLIAGMLTGARVARGVRTASVVAVLRGRQRISAVRCVMVRIGAGWLQGLDAGAARQCHERQQPGSLR